MDVGDDDHTKVTNDGHRLHWRGSDVHWRIRDLVLASSGRTPEYRGLRGIIIGTKNIGVEN